MDQARIAARIRELRKKNQLSQEQFAERLGVSRQTVSKWELAEATPELDKILLLSEQFRISTDYLLTGGERYRKRGWFRNNDLGSRDGGVSFSKKLGLLLLIAGIVGFAFLPLLVELWVMLSKAVWHGYNNGFMANISKTPLFWIVCLDAAAIFVGVIILLNKE